MEMPIKLQLQVVGKFALSMEENCHWKFFLLTSLLREDMRLIEGAQSESIINN